MSILIKGIDMPKDGGHLHLVVFSDGTLMDYNNKNKVCAVEVKEPHGDLIERDALKTEVYTMTEWNGDVHRVVYEATVDKAPTVLEAED